MIQHSVREAFYIYNWSRCGAFWTGFKMWPECIGAWEKSIRRRRPAKYPFYRTDDVL